MDAKRSESPRWVGWVEVLALSMLALAWCVSRCAWHVLDPRETAWMHNGDWEVYYQAWLLHTRGPWTLQLGAIPGLLYPHGLSVFYSGANFWLCLVGKLVAPFISGEFQLYGLFYLVGYVAQVLAYRWALTRAGVTGGARLAGALLGLVSPVLMARMGHIALMLHALTIVQVGLAVRVWRRPELAASTARWTVGVAVFAVGIEAYLAGQAIPLALAVLAITRLSGRRPWRLLVVDVALLGAGVLFMLWQVGAIPGGDVDRGADGFGQFSSDLFALFNSQGYSKWVPALPSGPRQGEGFAYLGVGGLAVLPVAAVSLGLWLRRRGVRALVHLWPLVVVVLLTAAYAWSSHVTVKGAEVLNLEWAFAPFASVTRAFRTCGRFIWPLHYLVSLGTIALAARALKWKGLAAVFLCVAAAAQAYELNANTPAFFSPPAPPIGPAWTGLGERYRHVEIVPVQVQWVCDYNPAVVSFLTRVAAQERMTINSGNVGRVPRAVKAACGAAFTGPMDLQTLYIVAPGHEGDVGLAGGRAQTIDGLTLLTAQ
ncbi:MAG: hypothetical protein IAE78_22320 [Myxococcus sp.]|nr:hypothetical protein [Myxococcus sp.]